MRNKTAFSFDWLDGFDDIRSLHEEEIPGAIAELLASDSFSSMLGNRMGNEGFEKIKLGAAKLDSTESIQSLIKERFIPLIADTYENIEIHGLDKLDTKQSYIFISNHHDILMDPMLVNISLLTHGFETAHCAIGDNLIQGGAAALLAGMNRCFKVKRSLTSPKAMLKAMRLQSEYINYLVFNKNSNIWIAQKEGRSKDNIDRTNPALIKMLMLAKPKEAQTDEFLEAQNIVPVAISYEWDPCDEDKAVQLLAEDSEEGFVRQASDDLDAMEKGIFGNKGNISIRFGEPLSSSEHTPLNRYEAANQIDQFIAQNTKLFPCHCAAHIIINKPNTNEAYPFPENDINKAITQLEERLQSSSEEIRLRVLTSYAQIFQNYVDANN